jgi:hypothetical protein
MLAPLIAFAAVAWFVRRAKAKAAAAPEEH